MKQYFLHDGNKQSGGFSLEEISKMQLNPTDHVWFDGLPDWQPVGNFAELKPFIRCAPPIFNAKITQLRTSELSPAIPVSNENTEIQKTEVPEQPKPELIHIDDSERLYPKSAFLISTLLFPTIFACYYFASHNFNIIQETKKAKNILIAGILLNLVPIIAIFCLPSSELFDENSKAVTLINLLTMVICNGYIIQYTNKVFKTYTIDLGVPASTDIQFYKSAGFLKSALFFVIYVIVLGGTFLIRYYADGRTPFFDEALYQKRKHQWYVNEKTLSNYINGTYKSRDTEIYYYQLAKNLLDTNEDIVLTIEQMKNIEPVTLNYTDLMEKYNKAKIEFCQLLLTATNDNTNQYDDQIKRSKENLKVAAGELDTFVNTTFNNK